MGFFSSPRRKKSKGQILRKKLSMIAKLEKKKRLDADLKAATKKLETLRRSR